MNYYDEILEPSFLPNGLPRKDDFEKYIASEDVLVTLHPSGDAVAVAERHEDLVLLEWIATRPGVRSRGLGGELLGVAMTQWYQGWNPTWVVAELRREEKRDIFYRRRGARLCEAVYIQPTATPGYDDVALELMVLRGPDGDHMEAETFNRILDWKKSPAPRATKDVPLKLL